MVHGTRAALCINNKNAQRTIDLDMSLWNNDVLEFGDKPWTIPDPDISRWAYVAIPLADLAPDYNHPTENKTLSEIANSLDKKGIETVELDFDLYAF